MHHLILCNCTFYICARGPCHQNHHEETGRAWGTPQHSIHDSRIHHHPSGILTEEHLILFQGGFFEQVERVVIPSSISLILVNLYMEDFRSRLSDLKRTCKTGEDMCMPHL